MKQTFLNLIKASIIVPVSICLIYSASTQAAEENGSELQTVNEILAERGIELTSLTPEQVQAVQESLANGNYEEVESDKDEELEAAMKSLQKNYISEADRQLAISDRRRLVENGIALQHINPFTSRTMTSKDVSFARAGAAGMLLPFVYQVVCDNAHKRTDNIIRNAVRLESGIWFAKALKYDFLIFHNAINNVIGGIQIVGGGVLTGLSINRIKTSFANRLIKDERKKKKVKTSCTAGLGVVILGQGVVRVLNIY